MRCRAVLPHFVTLIPLPMHPCARVLQERSLAAEGMSLGEANTGKSAFAMKLAAAGLSAANFKAAVRA